MLKVNTTSTVYGTANISVGTSDTRATNQVLTTNSRHAKGFRGIRTSTSSAIAKKPPTAAGGFHAGVNAIMSYPPRQRLSPSRLTPSNRMIRGRGWRNDNPARTCDAPSC